MIMCCQIDEFLLYLSRSSERYPVSASNSVIGPLNDSTDLRSYLRFPVCQKVLDMLMFFYSTYSSFFNFLSLIDEKKLSDDSMIILHKTCQIPKNVRYE